MLSDFGELLSYSGLYIKTESFPFDPAASELRDSFERIRGDWLGTASGSPDADQAIV